MDNLTMKFDLVDPNEKNNTQKITVEEKSETNLALDYSTSKEKLSNILEIGSDAIKDLADLAKASQDPEAYAVLATLMKNVADITNNISKQHKDYRNLQVNNTQKNSNVVMLDTLSLSRLLKDK